MEEDIQLNFKKIGGTEWEQGRIWEKIEDNLRAQYHNKKNVWKL